MKKLVILSSLFCSATFAAVPGYYVSAQLGYGLTQKSQAQASNIKSNKNKALTGRIGIGYAVQPSYSMEIGLARFGASNWAFEQDDQTQDLYKANYYAFNWMNKIRLFHTAKLNFTTSIGLAYVLSSYNTSTAFMHHLGRHPYLRPELDVGGDYAINDNLALTTSFYYIFGKGNLSKSLQNYKASEFLPNIYGVLVGLNYAY